MDAAFVPLLIRREDFSVLLSSVLPNTDAAGSMQVQTRTLTVPFRTLVVEDHKPFLEYICSTLRENPHLELVGQAENGTEAVERSAVLQPDLIFLDIGLPGINGLEAACRIRSLVPGAKIIFLTQETSPEIVHEALGLGASGYVLKSKSYSDLQIAIEAVLLGNRFVSEGLDGHGQ